MKLGKPPVTNSGATYGYFFQMPSLVFFRETLSDIGSNFVNLQTLSEVNDDWMEDFSLKQYCDAEYHCR